MDENTPIPPSNPPTQPESQPTPPEVPLQPYEPAASGSSLQAAQFSKTLPIYPEPNPTPLAEVPLPPGDLPLGNDSQSMGMPKEPTHRADPAWLTGVKAVGVFVGTFIFVLLLLQSPALFARAKFSLGHFGKKQTTANKIGFLPVLEDRAVTIAEIKNHPQDFLSPDIRLAGQSLTDLGDNQLLIPKLQVNAPVIWESPADEGTMLANLQKGVVHYGFTALPSDSRGNVFIAGHSSFFFWDPGKFKTIFANLDRLETGDQLAVTYEGVVYIYEVQSKKVVKPTDVSVLDQTAEPTLSLMTCVPVGTNLNRLVVQAKLVSAKSSQPIPLPPPSLANPAAIFHYLPA